MTRFKRRMLYGTALVALVLLWVGVAVYRPTRIALQRAESFQFRRMLVAQLGEQGTYRFFTLPTDVQHPMTSPSKDVSAMNGRRPKSSFIGTSHSGFLALCWEPNAAAMQR